jgi:hypothetical protein
VNLGYAAEFKNDPLYLLEVPPQLFRSTTFMVFALLQGVVGYQPEVFYGFSILVHFLSCLLLWKLLCLLGRGQTEAYLATSLFAVFQAPQEAVMWLSAMAESMLGLCVLAVLVLWVQGRYALSITVYCVALVTKEAAPVILVLIPLIEWYREEPLLRIPYLLFSGPTAVFGVAFLWLSSNNPMIQQGIYEFGPHAIWVLILSLHRLVWPWLYILIVLHRISAGRWVKVRSVAQWGTLLIVAVLPYVFLTYSDALPSRHVYLASMVLAGAMASLLGQVSNQRLRSTVVSAFIVFNIGYLWIRKDQQFEDRAAPTTALIEVLRTHSPEQITIMDFAYPYPIIAKAVPPHVPGWEPDHIRIDGVDDPCPACPRFQWIPESQIYLPVD